MLTGVLAQCDMMLHYYMLQDNVHMDACPLGYILQASLRHSVRFQLKLKQCGHHTWLQEMLYSTLKILKACIASSAWHVSIRVLPYGFSSSDSQHIKSGLLGFHNVL